MKFDESHHSLRRFFSELAHTLGPMQEMEPGQVWIAGASSRSGHQVTLEVLNALHQADVVLHDALIPHKLLRFIRPDCQVIALGKRAHRPSVRQETICELLIAKAQEGLRVLRLKGGDPGIFGRLADELYALHEHSIPLRILPGLTSAQSAAACLGIPLTHRDLSHALIYCTGSNSEPPQETHLDWQAIEQSQATIVLFMASKTLQTIASQLIRNGRDPKQPVAAISCLGGEPEEIRFSLLDNVAYLESLPLPVIFVIGEVVRLSPYFNLKLPLQEQKEMHSIN